MSKQHGSHIVIIGAGITGASCVRHLAGSARLTLLDTREKPPQLEALMATHPDLQCVTGVTSFDYAGVSRVIVSPGVSLSHPLVCQAAAAGVTVTSDIDLFCELADAPVYAITGTNGKSTVTSLAGSLLRAHGLKVAVGGNLGEPALDLLDESIRAYVLELSSFQLERMSAYPFESAVILNVTEDHIDRHGTLENYRAQKLRIFRSAQTLVWNRGDALTRPDSVESSQQVVTFSDSDTDADWSVVRNAEGSCIAFRGQALARVSAPDLQGRHNFGNLAAACAVAFGLQPDVSAIRSVADQFEGLPHRFRCVATIAGVGYINDSKATNVGAAVAALEGFPRDGKVLLIAGGDAKGADLSPLAAAVDGRVRQMFLIGQDADKLAAGVPDVPHVRCGTLEAAVRAAAAVAVAGDVVLLSPACASLDMFSSYAERGDRFAAAVRELAR